MKSHLIATSLRLGSFAAPSFADDSKNLYLSVGGGLAFPSDIEGGANLGGVEYDASFPVDSTGFYSVAIGTQSKYFRLEFNYQGANVSTSSINVTNSVTGASAVSSITPEFELDIKSYMLYGYIDANNDAKFTPYLGFGAGISEISGEDQTATVAGANYSLIGTDESAFTFGGKVGANYQISDSTAIYTEGTYMNIGEISVGTAIPVNYDATHIYAVSAGLKFNF